MSLLNEVLKDLDDRRSTDSDSSALHEYAAAKPGDAKRKKLLIGGLLAVGTLVLVSFSGWMVMRGGSDRPSVKPVPPVASSAVQSVAQGPQEAKAVPRIGKAAIEAPQPVQVAKAPTPEKPPESSDEVISPEVQTNPRVPKPTQAVAVAPKFAASSGPVEVDVAARSVTVKPVAMAPVIKPKSSPSNQPPAAVTKPAPVRNPVSRSTALPSTPSYTRTESFATSAPVNRYRASRSGSTMTPSSRPSTSARYIYERDLKMRAAAEEKIRVGEYRQAETDLQQFIAEQPEAKLSRSVLASLLIKLGRPDEAEMVLIGGIAQDKEGRDQVKLLARTYLARGDVTGAIRLLDANRVSVADDPEFHSLLGALYQKAGRHEAAVRTYRSLLGEYPPQAAWWLGQAISLEALGRRREAVVAYRQARDSYGTRPELKNYAAQRITALVR